MGLHGQPAEQLTTMSVLHKMDTEADQEPVRTTRYSTQQRGLPNRALFGGLVIRYSTREKWPQNQ